MHFFGFHERSFLIACVFLFFVYELISIKFSPASFSRFKNKKQTRSAPLDLKYHVALVCWSASSASLMVKLCRSHRLWASLRHNIKPPFFWALFLSLSRLHFYSQIFHFILNRVVVVQWQVFTNSVTITLCSITVLQM